MMSSFIDFVWGLIALSIIVVGLVWGIALFGFVFSLFIATLPYLVMIFLLIWLIKAITT